METEKDEIVEIRSKNMLEKAYMREVVWRPIIMLPWESNNYDMANDYDQKRTYTYRFSMNWCHWCIDTIQARVALMKESKSDAFGR